VKAKWRIMIAKREDAPDFLLCESANKKMLKHKINDNGIVSRCFFTSLWWPTVGVRWRCRISMRKE